MEYKFYDLIARTKGLISVTGITHVCVCICKTSLALPFGLVMKVFLMVWVDVVIRRRRGIVSASVDSIKNKSARTNDAFWMRIRPRFDDIIVKRDTQGCACGSAVKRVQTTCLDMRTHS